MERGSSLSLLNLWDTKAGEPEGCSCLRKGACLGQKMELIGYQDSKCTTIDERDSSAEPKSANGEGIESSEVKDKSARQYWCAMILIKFSPDICRWCLSTMNVYGS